MKEIWQREIKVVPGSKIIISCHGIPIEKMAKLRVKNQTLVHCLVL